MPAAKLLTVAKIRRVEEDSMRKFNSKAFLKSTGFKCIKNWNGKVINKLES